MTGKTAACMLASVLLAFGPATFAQDFDGGCCHGHRHHDWRSCCRRLCAWWTYCPLHVPHELKGCLTFQQTPQPANYAYFVYLFGPRSPALGFPPTPVHHGDVCAQALPPVPTRDATGEILAPIPEEELPTPRQRTTPTPAVPDPGTLPNEAPEEASEQTEPAAGVTRARVPVREKTDNSRP